MGKANVILDNLIAQGKAKPMLIVMTLGYGAPEIVSQTAAGCATLAFASATWIGTARLCSRSDSSSGERIPRFEGSDSRAIAGLSMGGADRCTPA